MNNSSLFSGAMIVQSAKATIPKLAPSVQARNPVMFVTYCVAILSSALVVWEIFTGGVSSFSIQVSLWLWGTVIFAAFAEAFAEGRGKAQAAYLRSLRSSLTARKIIGEQAVEVPAEKLSVGDVVLCEAGDTIPSDGEVIWGIATVDESAITGESAPVIRESGGDRSAVTGGTVVLSDAIRVRITAEEGKSFLDSMVALVEGASRRKTPNELALGIVLSSLSIIFLLVVVALPFMVRYVASESTVISPEIRLSVLLALVVCLIPTTIGGLLSAIGISGIDRLTRKNVIAKSGKAVEAAGDLDVLLLDKTGTITIGNRIASEFIPAPNIPLREFIYAAHLASLADTTPEGRSIVALAEQSGSLFKDTFADLQEEPFSAETRMSGVDIPSRGMVIRKGAADAVYAFVRSHSGTVPPQVEVAVREIAGMGGTPLVVADRNRILGVIRLKDMVKPGIKERFDTLRAMGIKTVMITGDNPITASAIAAEAGVDDFVAEATPKTKMEQIRRYQQAGNLVGMVGDGTNDAPALAQADVGIAMNTGTQAAREAGSMVDLDSDPTKIIDVVETGKQLLMTRGALTTFSIANDVAKYFAILPALFTVSAASPMAKLNVMDLGSPESAILSAVIFNALIIVALIPLALRGVRFAPMSAARQLRRNLLIYGVGGVILPFAGIKLIDVIILSIGLVQ